MALKKATLYHIISMLALLLGTALLFWSLKLFFDEAWRQASVVFVVALLFWHLSARFVRYSLVQETFKS